MFLVVAACATALNLIAHWLERLGVDAVLTYTFYGMEYLLLGLDVYLFAGYFCEASVAGHQEFWGWVKAKRSP